MLSVAEQLDEKLRRWDPEIAISVEKLINEIIMLADEDSPDLLRTRSVEQEVLDILDET
jgi:hypothetical protein